MTEAATTILDEDTQLYHPGPGEYARVKKFDLTTVGCVTLAGLLAPVCASPFVAVVDATVIGRMKGGGGPIWPNIKAGWIQFLKRPFHFWFIDPKWRVMNALVVMVYSGTYVSANVMSAYCESHGIDPKWPAVYVSCPVNIGLTVLKDVIMSLLVQTSKKKTRTPGISAFFFGVRDFITMAAAFYAAPALGDWLVSLTGCREFLCQVSAKLFIPTILQTVSTVLHLGALQYGNDTSQSLRTIGTHVSANYTQATMGRMCRILPAIGVAGNVNDFLKSFLLSTCCTTAKAQRYSHGEALSLHHFFPTRAQ